MISYSPNRPVDLIRVIEVQYVGTQPVAFDYWPFDAYRRESVYGAARVPTEVVPFRDLEPEDLSELDPPLREAVAAGGVNRYIASFVIQSLEEADVVLLTGGTCHHVTGVLGGLQQIHGAGAHIGLIWFDAHGDFNTPQTTISGSLGGMPLAVCAGLCWPAWRERSGMEAPVPIDRIIHWDGRDLDPAEETLMTAVGLPRATSVDGDEATSLANLVAEMQDTVDIIYLHIDADILDARYVPGHRTPADKGPDMQQVLRAIDLVMETGLVLAGSVVSVFPGPKRAAQSGCELVRGMLLGWKQHGYPEF